MVTALSATSNNNDNFSNSNNDDDDAIVADRLARGIPYALPVVDRFPPPP